MMGLYPNVFFHIQILTKIYINSFLISLTYIDKMFNANIDYLEKEKINYCILQKNLFHFHLC